MAPQMTKPARKPVPGAPEAAALSVGGRRWRLLEAEPRAVQSLLPAVGGSDLLARLLAVRGVEAAGAAGYLAPTLREFFPDPSSFADMDKAAGVILDAVLDGRKVVVFADYDVDGGTSSAILARYFRAWGRDLGLYVPDRLEEGYGPSPEAFRYLKAQGAELVITVDCGAAAIRALDEAVAIDLPIVVIDHHLMSGAVPHTARGGRTSSCTAAQSLIRDRRLNASLTAVCLLWLRLEVVAIVCTCKHLAALGPTVKVKKVRA
jgi:hypothetical protein